jgi:ABC-type Co2+ transport system permease subunit
MTPTRIRGLVVVAVVCAAATWLLLLHAYSSLPPLPWTMVLTLLLLAVVEARAGYLIKARLSGRRRPDQDGTGRWARPRPLQPIAIARTAAVAKASALAAAVIGGVACGFVLDLVRSLSQPIPRQDMFTALGILGGSVVLAVAAVYLERSCQVPPDHRQGSEAGTGTR